DDARRDVREDRLEIAAARLELGAARLQVGGHPVEGVDERPDLVRALAFDPVVEVALRDGARPLGEALDRDGDAAGEIEAEPGRGEEDDDRHDGERDRVVRLDRAALYLQPEVLVESALALLPSLDDAPRDVRVDDDGADRASLDLDGHRGADHVRLADGVDERRLLAARRAVEELALRVDAEPTDVVGTPRAADRLAVDEDLDHIELVLETSLVDEFPERVALRVELVAGDAGGQLAREAERRAREVLVVRVRDLERTLERVLDLAVEPPLDRVADEDERHEEEERRGKQRDRDERADEPRPQVRAHDAPPALEDQLRDVPADEEDEQDEEDQVQVDERDQHRVGAERPGPEGLRQPELENREEQHRRDDPSDDPPFAPAAAHLGR